MPKKPKPRPQIRPAPNKPAPKSPLGPLGPYFGGVRKDPAIIPQSGQN